MNKQITITPEIARLAQQRVKALGTSLSQELARLMVEELIMTLPSESEFFLDYSASYSNNDSLIQALGANDIVISGRHIDVRVLDNQGQVSINRSLIGTSYLESGSLVVSMESFRAGSLVGYISAAQWQACDQQTQDPFTASIKLNADARLDLCAIIGQLCASAPLNSQLQHSESLPEVKELTDFVVNRQIISLSRQRQIVEMALSNLKVQETLQAVNRKWSNENIKRIMLAESVWMGTVENLVSKLTPKFKRLTAEEIRSVILQTGEIYGGHPEIADFRKSMLRSLLKQELLRTLKGVDLKKITAVAEKVLSGRSVIEAVGDFVNNRVAVDLAVAIKRQRNKVEGFMNASAEEIGMAFQQLSLQPAYATHSQDPSSGIESINEALEMLEAAELAEEVKLLEDELFQD